MHGEQLDDSDWAADGEKLIRKLFGYKYNALNLLQDLKKKILCVVTLEFRASTGYNVGSSFISHSSGNWQVVMSWLQNTFVEYCKKWVKMVAVQHKRYWFAWKNVPMWTYMYKGKELAPGFKWLRNTQQYYAKWQC